MKVDPFPGKLEKKLVHYAYKYVLTEEQRQWLIRWFPEEQNGVLMEISGITHSTLHRFARELGLKKSKKGMHRIMKRQAAGVKKLLEENGYYDSMRGRPVSDACKAATARMWQEIREGKRLHPIRQLKKTNPGKYRRRSRKISESRKELVRRDKLRISYGMSRLTKLHLPPVPFTKSQVSHRLNALKRGYFYLAGKITGNERYDIYYDDQTVRSEKFEQNLVNDHFRVLRWED